MTLLPSIPTPDFESIAEIQVCHFVDQLQDDGLILWSLLSFHVIHHIKFDDTSCHITAYFTFVFICLRQNTHIWTIFGDRAGVELCLFSLKIWLITLFFHIKLPFLFKNHYKRIFHSLILIILSKVMLHFLS